MFGEAEVCKESQPRGVNRWRVSHLDAERYCAFVLFTGRQRLTSEATAMRLVGREDAVRWDGSEPLLGECSRTAIQVDDHAATDSPVMHSTSAETSTSATGGVTALPNWRTLSRLLPSTM